MKKTLVFATGNAHKLSEVRKLLPQYRIPGLKDLQITEDIPEDGDTAEANAVQKTDYIKKHYGYDAFSDDTVLEVEALNGEPGVYSARYAGEPPNPEANIDKLLRKLEKHENRNAHFKTVISLNMNGKQMLFEGICKGHILRERHGDGGFGYDAIFQPEGYDISFAQMSADEKNSISHRGKAVRQLVEYLNSIQ